MRWPSRRATSVASLTIVLLVVACKAGVDSFSSESGLPPLASLSIEPDSLSLPYPGVTAVLRGVVIDTEGNKRLFHNKFWTTEDTSIVILSSPVLDQVKGDGSSYNGADVTVRGRAAGTATIVCSMTTPSEERLSATAVVVVASP